MAGLFSAKAQFSDIAVTDDAGQIYFVSSVPLRGESNPGGGIYRWSGTQWEQFVPPVPFEVKRRDPYRDILLVRPVVSGGGTVVAWSIEHHCSGRSGCIGRPTYWESVIATAGGQQTVPGKVQISRNGRYLIQTQEVYVFSTPYRVTRIFRDLHTGMTVDLAFAPRAVLSDGRVLGSDADGLFLWSSSGTVQRIAGTAGLIPGTISDNGARILVFRASSAADSDSELLAVSVQSGRTTTIGRFRAAEISNDGLRALVLTRYTSEAWSVDLVSGTRTPLVAGTPVKSGALAGFGQFAVLATGDGRLLKVDLTTGQADEIFARTPQWSSPLTATPCSATSLRGTNIVGTREAPSVSLDDTPIPVLTASEAAIWVQIPCELEPSPVPRLLDLRTASPFGPPGRVQLRRYDPLVVSVAHQDFSEAVSAMRPARPGEIIHIWGTGFGPVDRVMRTGESAPADSPAQLLNPVSCRTTPSETPVEVLFAGLAPGLIGFYQLDLVLPSDASQGIRCTLAENQMFTIHVPTAS
jgi:uncharacterized protein (TIGR03437 family)